MWISAQPLNAPKIRYIFQLMRRSSGGTANASAQFMIQFDAVDSDTACARTLRGKISDGIVHEMGPHVVANVATKRYEHAITALACVGRFSSFQVMGCVGSVSGTPYAPWIEPEMNSQVIMPKEPASSAGRRPSLSMKIMAGIVITTLITYWIAAETSGSSTPAPCIT